MSGSKEERWNSVSHALGIVLGIIGLYFLLENDTQKTVYSSVSTWVYSMSVILLFTTSTSYHLATEPRLKARLRIADHISIYLLIAGTYTPVALITLEQGNGWLILYIVWGIAALGTALKLFFTGKYEIFSLLLYLAMGWLIILDFSNLIANTSSLGLWLLFAGGAFYTVGIIFYVWRRIPYNHFIWHLFVLGGAISHWGLIYIVVS